MTTVDSSREELLNEISDRRLRLEEAEETLRAIGSGEVDAFVVSGLEGEQVFTLAGAEQPYRVLVETMSEGAATLASDGTILYCNNRMSAMLQVPLEKLIGVQLGSYVAPADQPIFAARLRNCSYECDKDEITMITGAGNFVPVLISCCTVDLSGNREIGIVITDLTQQKRNEETMAAERLARCIIEQAGEAIIVCDEEGRIIRASRLAHDLCGQNLLLKSFNDLFPLRILETESLFSVLTPLNGARLDGVEVEFKRSDDQIYHLILTAAPLKCVQNRINGCVVTLTDISERMRAEEALKNINDELEIRVEERTAELREKDQILIQQGRQAAMGEMIGNIAHQWRQPLNALGLVTQQSLMFYDLGEFDREFLEKNVVQSMELIRHMSQTIDDFRDYFRPDKEMAEFKVSEVIQNTVILIEDSFKNHHVSLVVVAKGDPAIFGYRNEFSQALLNILNNARDALTERGTKDPRVTITIDNEGDRAVVTITDNAGGIPEEIMGKIFDPYFTTKGPQQGTGVGLFMTRAIIEKNMGGRLVAYNIADGAEFRIEV